MKIGIIGGGFFWGNWNLPFKKIDLDTPYGKPADLILSGQLGCHEVFTLQRHGQNTQLSPELVPWKANAVAFANLEVDCVIHVSLCGALNPSFNSGDIFIFDQLIDHTKTRPQTLGQPLITKISHLDFSEPISKQLLALAEVAFSKDPGVRIGGTMLTEEGPRFCTSAEAKVFIQWGADALNMTSCPEVYLFRELSIPVLPMCLVTNSVKPYDPILTEHITATTVQFKERVPAAVKHFIEHLPKDVVIDKPHNNVYDVQQFDSRKG